MDLLTTWSKVSSVTCLKCFSVGIYIYIYIYIYDSKEHVPIPENAPILVSRKYMSRIQPQPIRNYGQLELRAFRPPIDEKLLYLAICRSNKYSE